MARFQPINLLGILIAIGLIYQSLRLVRNRKESVLEFLLWSVFGTGLLILSIIGGISENLISGATDFVLESLGVDSGPDGIFVLSIIGLMLMLFYTYISAKTNEQQIQDLNQEIALLRYEMDDGREERAGEEELE